MNNLNMSYLLKCPDYKSYLERYVKPDDFYYLRNGYICRMLVTLGYRSPSPVFTPSQFFDLKNQILESLAPAKKISVLFSSNMRSPDPVLIELAQREALNQHKIISTILFIASGNKTGYIDYQQSLNRAYLREEGATDWVKVFQEETKIYPKKTDLSYYNWTKRTVCYNNSDNYNVKNHREYGLIFIYRGDHKKISVNMNNRFKTNCQYSTAYSPIYGHVVFMDHVIRKKV